MALAYRTPQAGLNSSDSETDDSDDGKSWKHRTVKLPTEKAKSMEIAEPEPPPSSKKPIGQIWSSLLTEQTLTEDFTSCGVKRGLVIERESESYEILGPYSKRRKSPEREDEEEESENVEDPTLGLPKLSSQEQEMANRFARIMIKKLKEPKHELMRRCVIVLGIEKCNELLKATEAIEKDGGMMILKGTRRRTPGGVFLNLLKNDKSITLEQTEIIFALERKIQEEIRLKKMKNKNKKRRNLHPKNHKKELPSQEDTMEVVPSEEPEKCPGNGVSSPPPSPVESKVVREEPYELEEGEIED